MYCPTCTEARLLWCAIGHTHTNHLRELSCSDFILLSAAPELIFAEGLTDITKLHLTYWDVAPVVFTEHECVCVCLKMIFRVCVYTPVFIWKRRSGAGGHQPAHVFNYSSSCRQLTSGGRCCVCVNVPNDLNTHTDTHAS